MIIRYCGAKPLPRVLDTPIPFLSHAEKTGQLVFNPECDVQDEASAKFLLEQCGDAFVLVSAQESPSQDDASPNAGQFTKEKLREKKIEQAQTRKFKGKAGKWQAQAYLKRNDLENVLRLEPFRIGGKILYWHLVPVTDSSAGNIEAPIPAQAEGQEELNDVRDDEREAVTIEG